MHELHAAALQDIGRPHGFAAAGAEPAAHLLARHLLEPGEALPDLRLLVLDLLERALKPAVADELPARIHRGLGERRIDVRALRVDEGRRLDAALPQHVEQARHAAAHAVLDPGVVGKSGGSIWAPCGGGRMPRGIGRSNGQYSMLTTELTISGLPPIGSSRARSVDIWKGMRGLGHIGVSRYQAPALSRAGSKGRSRAGSKADKSMLRAAPSTISSAIASPVAGALRMPQTLWPVAT